MVSCNKQSEFTRLAAVFSVVRDNRFINFTGGDNKAKHRLKAMQLDGNHPMKERKKTHHCDKKKVSCDCSLPTLQLVCQPSHTDI